MGNLSRLAWSHLIDHQGHDRHGFSIERGKFDLITFARRTHENDRADIASSKAVLRQTAVQDHVFQFLNHLLLRKRGSCNESRCFPLVVNNQAVRTFNMRLSGTCKGPSITYRVPNLVFSSRATSLSVACCLRARSSSSHR